MKRNELIKLRELVEKEEQRRIRIEELLNNNYVLEYLRLLDIKPSDLDSNNINEIINYILKDFKITKTNELYVCTEAYYVDYDICYEDTNYYTQDVCIDSEYAEHRIYTDIESGESRQATKDKDIWGRPLISDFESNNIVLNPTNSNKNNNNYDEVRLDFMKTAIDKGQSKARKLILSKYNRL